MASKVRLSNAVDWFSSRYVSADDADDIDAHRRSLLIVHIAVVYMVAGFGFSSLYLALGMWLAASGAGVAMVVGAGILLRPQPKVHSQSYGRLLNCVALFAFVTGTIDMGGLLSPGLVWFPFAAMIGFITSSKRDGVVTVAAIVVFFSFLYGAHYVGVAFPVSVSDDWMALFALVSPVGALGCTAAVVWSHEAGRQDAVRRADVLRQGTRRLLDSVSDGLVVVSMDGTVHPERSAAAERLLPGLRTADTLWSAVALHDLNASEWMAMGWEDLNHDIMPRAVVLDQLPSQVLVGARTLNVRYEPILEANLLVGLLVVFSDVSDAIVAARAQEEQQDIVAIFLQLSEHPSMARVFLNEVRQLVRNLDVGGEDVHERRWIHTLKGCVATFGLTAFARYLHEAETNIHDNGEVCDELRMAIVQRWTVLEQSLAPVLAGDGSSVPVDQIVLEQLIERARNGMPGTAIADVMERWMWGTVRCRLEQLAVRGTRVAERLGKSHVRVVADGDEIELPPSEHGAGFWASLVHVVRNAVDHGIETVEERQALGKQPMAEVRLSAWVDEQCLFVSVQDDGRGLQWDALRRRAESAGLPSATREDLVDLLFQDGVSTAAEVSDVSGRGVGLAALRHELQLCNGDVTIDTASNEGTRFTFKLPFEASRPLAVAS